MENLSNNDEYQEVKLVRIREYELPALKRAVIYVQKNVVQLDPEVFPGHNMDRDNKPFEKLAETKPIQQQNKFRGMAKVQIVDSKTSKMRPRSKYEIFNNIETAPIKLEKKCMPLENNKYPVTFLEELKELQRISK